MQLAGNPMISKINWRIAILCIAGLILSIYTAILSFTKKQQPSYSAFCDITETVSCTDVLTSEYSKGFGIISKNCFLRLYEVPNYVFGIAFFSLMLILGLKNSYVSSAASLVLGSFSILISIYLAFILYKLKKICILCVTTYIVCTLLMYYSLRKFRIIHTSVAREKKTE